MLQYSQLDSVLAAVVLAAEELEAGWAEWEVLVGDTDCSSTQVTHTCPARALTRATCPGAAARGGDVLPPQAWRVPGPGLPLRAGPRGQVRGEDSEVGSVEAP